MGKRIISLVSLFILLAMLPSALSYSYNDTLENDSTLILTASREIYGLSPNGNYNVYIELENDGVINYTDIDFEIYIEKEYTADFEVIEIYEEQLIYGPVAYTEIVECPKVNQHIDIN